MAVRERTDGRELICGLIKTSQVINIKCTRGTSIWSLRAMGRESSFTDDERDGAPHLHCEKLRKKNALWNRKMSDSVIGKLLIFRS